MCATSSRVLLMPKCPEYISELKSQKIDVRFANKNLMKRGQAQKKGRKTVRALTKARVFRIQLTED